jgi:hypothetical protein
MDTSGAQELHVFKVLYITPNFPQAVKSRSFQDNPLDIKPKCTTIIILITTEKRVANE